MASWEYKIAYVDFRGRISSEGSEFIRQPGEHRTSFVRRYLDVLGQEGWEVAAVQPLRRSAIMVCAGRSCLLPPVRRR